MKRNQCLFCGGGPLTREHIFPNWLSTFFKSEINVNDFSTEVLSPSNELLHEWSKNDIDDTIKMICKKCNNGWMSLLENEVKSYLTHMIRGNWPISLDKIKCENLSLWVYKTALILDKCNYGIQNNLTELGS